MTYEKGIPDYAMVPAKEMEERILLPITKGAVYTPVQVTDITEKPKTTITLEEDILVPDIKPDLREILLIDGTVHPATREIDQLVKGDDYISLSGEVELQTLYLPEKKEGSCPIISVQSRIPFKDRWPTTPAPGATLILDFAIEKIEYMFINERKYRVKLLISVSAKEYTAAKLDIFEGLIDEDIQMLRESIELSNVSLRKKDTLSIREDILPRDDVRPESLLKQDLTIVENYKQITGDKVVISGFVYVNLLYYAHAGESKDLAQGLHQIQERIEFTQFIPIHQGESQSGCNTVFDSSQLRVKLTQDEEERDVFRLEGELITYLELYSNTEKEIIVDGYHRQKDFVCDFEDENSITLLGTSTGETSVREIISLEGAGCDVDRILYTTARILGSESRCEQGKIITEGNILVKLICYCVQEPEQIFSAGEELPFRIVTAMPQVLGTETVTDKVYIKDLWAEKINGKQLEFNATIMVCAEVMKPTPFKLLTNPAFEDGGSKSDTPPMVVYICKEDDSLWHIAKQFKTTMEIISQINDLDALEPLVEGQKLLILK